MKKILFISLAFCYCSCVFSQEISGSFAVLQNFDNVIHLEFNYKSIHGMTENDFAEYETDWRKDKNNIEGIFISKAMDKTPGVTLSKRTESPYTIRMDVNSISRKGDYQCDAVLLDQQGKELGKIKDIKGKGGTFGTKLNLISDGAKSTGAKFGKLLRKAINSGK